jgi:outer membrane protein TolC
MSQRTHSSIASCLLALFLMAAAVLTASQTRAATAGERAPVPASTTLRRTAVEGTAHQLPISLAQSVLLALQNNQELQVERLSPLIRDEEVRRETGAFFAPRLSFEASADRTQRPSGSVLAGAQVLESQNVDVNTGVSMRSITGGIVALDFRNKRLETNSLFQIFDPQYTAELALTLTHPLLKNFGIDLNSARIKVAKNHAEISRQQLQVMVTNLVTEVQQAYWDLVLAANDLAARQRALEVARHLEQRTAALVDRGRLPALATLQARAATLEREVDVLSGEHNFADAQQRLKALLNLHTMAPDAGLTLVPVDLPVLEIAPVSAEEGLKTAMARRPELSQAQLEQENRRLAASLARNQMLPEINVVGSVGLSGLSGDPSDSPFATLTVGGIPVGSFFSAGQGVSSFEGGYDHALSKMLSGDFISYKVGVTIQVPLGNQSARSELAKAKLEVEKANISRQALEQKIALEVERVARGIHAQVQAITGAKSLRALAERQLEMAQDGLELGVSSVTDVLQGQRNLALAQRDELRAIIEYNKALTLWEKITGTALERFHILL